MPPDLVLALRMADAADAITMAWFRSPDLAVETKGDGTPVTAVDKATEQAMCDMAAAERPDDVFLGEEIGEIGTLRPGGRRWIFDGIDGTHNYAAGNISWGTMLGLEVDGVMTLGVVTSPAADVRWYAARGFGTWKVRLDLIGAQPEQVRVTDTTEFDQARILTSPPKGFLAGWRSDAAGELAQGEIHHPRNFAWAGTLVADGSHDATVLFSAAPWDIAANVAIVEEAGGVYRTLWDDRSLDTTTAIYCRAELLPAILERLSPFVPSEPDPVVRFKPPTVATPSETAAG